MHVLSRSPRPICAVQDPPSSNICFSECFRSSRELTTSTTGTMGTTGTEPAPAACFQTRPEVHMSQQQERKRCVGGGGTLPQPWERPSGHQPHRRPRESE